jgi:uncharacterized protein YdhG (YjbR/CyaY superfamily)
MHLLPDPCVPGRRHGGRRFRRVRREHLSYLPFSGSTLATLAAELDGYTRTKSALHFTPEHSLPKSLVRALIDTRLEEIESRGH